MLWAGADGFHVMSGSKDSLITCMNTSYVAALNAAATVVGTSGGSPATPESWSAGTCGSLPLLANTPASAGGAAEAINDQGVVVGRSGSAASGTAVEWVGGKVLDLNTLLPANSGWVLQNAFGINSSGQILGSGTLSGQPAYFVLGGGASLSVTVTPTVPPGGLAVGGQLAVPVTVTAGPTAVNNVKVSLTIGAPGAVTVIQTPAGTSGFSLTANQSRTFTFTIQAVKTGQAVLNASASGSGASGSASTSFPVSQKALQITIAAQPGEIRLEADDDGKLVPKTITVRVKLTNTTKDRLTGVQLLSLSPDPANPSQQLDKLAFPKDSLPVQFGTIEAGAGKVKTFTLKVTGDGTYLINALALYSDPTQSGGNGRAVGQGGAFTVDIPLLYFKAIKEDDVKSVVAGGSWYVSGHVKNLSSFQTLCLVPLQPDWTGNAGGLGPHQIGVVPIDDPAPPLAGPLMPGQTISFLMRAQTEDGGSPASMVELHPQATKGTPGDDCNVLAMLAQPALADTDVKLAKDSTQFSVDVTPAPIVAPVSYEEAKLEFIGGYAEGSAQVLAQLYESGLSIYRDYGSIEKLEAALRSGAGRASTAISQLFHSAGVMAWFWITTNEQEHQEFLEQVANDFVAKAGKWWDGTQAKVAAAAGAFLAAVQKAYFSGDWRQLFYAFGKGAGGVINEQAITMASGRWRSACLEERARSVRCCAARAPRAREQVLTSSEDGPVGELLNFAEMQRLWGLA